MPVAAVLAQVEIELVALLAQTTFLHALQQYIVVILPLTAADDLTDAGYETVHSRHRPAVRV